MNANILVIIIHSVISLISYIKLDINKLFILNSVLLLVSSLGNFSGEMGNGEKGRGAG